MILTPLLSKHAHSTPSYSAANARYLPRDLSRRSQRRPADCQQTDALPILMSAYESRAKVGDANEQGIRIPHDAGTNTMEKS